MNAALGFGTPFAAAIDHLRAKLALPTERWDDIQRQAHDRAFIVAGAAKADLVQDLQQAVIKAGEGEGLAGFRKNFQAIVARHGWTGWTGEGSPAGVAWRTRVIYQTNMATAQAAGRWRQLTDPAVAALLPWFVYRHADGVLHPRPLHVAWNGLTLRQDHPFWKTHWAPNDWYCHCKVFAVAIPPAGARTSPPEGWDQPDPATGELPGIGKGWGYAPGAHANTPLQKMVDDKLINLDAPIGAAMWQQLQPVLAQERQQQWLATLGDWLAGPAPAAGAAPRTQVVGALGPQVVEALPATAAAPANAAIAVPDSLVLASEQQAGQQAALSLADWHALPALLDQPAAVYFELGTGRLVYVNGRAGRQTALWVAPAQPGQPAQVVSAAQLDAGDAAAAVNAGRWQVLR